MLKNQMTVDLKKKFVKYLTKYINIIVRPYDKKYFKNL